MCELGEECPYLNDPYHHSGVAPGVDPYNLAQSA